MTPARTVVLQGIIAVLLSGASISAADQTRKLTFLKAGPEKEIYNQHGLQTPSRLIGKYDNAVAFGQERALVVWQRIILPDGSSIVIDNLPATDTGGYAGLADEVDLHTWKLLKGVAPATVMGVGSELAFGNAESDLVKALQQSTGKVGSARVMRRPPNNARAASPPAS